MDEDFGEIQLAIDAIRLEAVQPCLGRALEHGRNILHGNAPVATCYVDCGGVVNQPILRIHGAVVLGSVSWEREPFGKGLVADAGAKSRRADIIFFF